MLNCPLVHIRCVCPLAGIGAHSLAFGFVIAPCSLISPNAPKAAPAVGDSLVVMLDVSSGEASCLGRGIYGLAEAARMIGVSSHLADRWTRPFLGSPPVLVGELGGMFSFWDLLSLRVVAVLVRMGVRREQIVEGSAHLESRLGTHRPFAHAGLRDTGARVFADLADTGEQDRQVRLFWFGRVIGSLLVPITFNDTSMAAIWRPWADVWVNPSVQAGKACVDGTRVPTSQVALMLGDGTNLASDNVAEVCDEYRLNTRQVLSAFCYERSLS